MTPSFTLIPVGRVVSTVKRPQDAPHQGRDAHVEVSIVVGPEFRDALIGIEEYRRLVILCWLHLADRKRLTVHPRGNPDNPLRGVFSTRSPMRPNPLAVYTAELIEVRDLTLRVRGVDAVDGTPVVDIRPHVTRLDD